MPRIAIEYDTPDQASYIPQVERLVGSLGFAYEILSSEEIMDGALLNFDAVIFPGGTGAFYGLRNYENFDDPIRYFVANGGGYMGVCGGAYVAGLDMSEFLKSYCPRTLGLIDTKIVTPPFIKYIAEYREAAGQRVAVTCKVTEQSHPIIAGYEGQTIDIVYSGGPLIKEPGPDVIPLLSYLDSIMPAGDVAMCCSIFGKGRVVISSPHPETPWGEELVGTGCQEWLYLNMIQWVSQPEKELYFPFLPWQIKRVKIPYPAIPSGLAFGLGIMTTVGLTQLAKKKAD